MSGITLDWTAIRPLNGGREKGFEELCSQLARTEAPGGARFVRKGTPDAGVECYAVLAEEPSSIVFVARIVGTYDFDRDNLIPHVKEAGLVDRPHASFGEFIKDLIPAFQSLSYQRVLVLQ